MALTITPSVQAYHSYRVRIDFGSPPIQAGEEISVCDVQWCPPPPQFIDPADLKSRYLAIHCTDLRCIYLHERNDRAIIENLANYLQETGPVTREAANEERAKNISLSKQRAESDGEIIRALMKEDLQLALVAWRLKHPGVPDSELIKKILRENNRNGNYNF